MINMAQYALQLRKSLPASEIAILKKKLAVHEGGEAQTPSLPIICTFNVDFLVHNKTSNSLSGSSKLHSRFRMTDVKTAAIDLLLEDSTNLPSR